MAISRSKAQPHCFLLYEVSSLCLPIIRRQIIGASLQLVLESLTLCIVIVEDGRVPDIPGPFVVVQGDGRLLEQDSVQNT